jgi:hypothetical protein
MRSTREENEMKNRCILVTASALFFLTACSASPPAPAIRTAVSGTQTAWPTQTPYPTYTPFPPTPNPTKVPFTESFSVRLFPGVGATLIYASQTGTEFWLEFPAGATAQPARAALIPELASDPPAALGYFGDAFVLLAGLGDQMEGYKGFTFDRPVPVTVRFAAPRSPEDRALYTWTGSGWERVETVCSLPQPTIDADSNTLRTSLCSPGAFAIFAASGG